ncbi:MAG TPA: site-2 protease family protein, partial [Candidatus Eisenbacteria bacterium]|nr:site-2 protease family protein [Candidatus Eisenbacteria bacterium]
LGPVGAAIAFLLGKLKALSVLVTVLKLKTLLTMALTIGVYATQWGWAFAVGFVLLIFVHEMGHVFVLKAEGIPASAPVFIPFLGAFVAMRAHPKDAWSEFKVAVAGPVLGSIGAGLTLAAGLALHHPLLVQLGRVGLAINLFNLVPVSPLDGGRILAPLPRAFWVAGFALGVAAWLALRSPLLLIALVIGLIGLYQRWHRPIAPAATWQRVVAGASWLALVAALGAVLAFVH